MKSGGAKANSQFGNGGKAGSVTVRPGGKPYSISPKSGPKMGK